MVLRKGVDWHPEFTPSYTPKEMIELGVFEGLYTAAIDGLPDDWLSSNKVLPRGSKPNPKLNRFGVKSRLSLKEWEQNGWTTENSPLGWFQWYCLYFLGRRLPEEDEWQINRWKSFIARHQAQIYLNCKLKDYKCRPKQRQGLLQWAWDSATVFDSRQRDKNINRIIKLI